MKLCQTALLTTGLLLAGVATAAATTTLKVMMQEKLQAAHGLLEGIVREDFAMIELNGGKLHNISKVTEWHKPDSPEFLHYAKSFQNSTEFLIAEAKAKSLDGVAMGYVRVTLDCMQCHNYVRAGRTKK